MGAISHHQGIAFQDAGGEVEVFSKGTSKHPRVSDKNRDRKVARNYKFLWKTMKKTMRTPLSNAADRQGGVANKGVVHLTFILVAWEA